MHLVCSSCRYHSKNDKIVECPRCGIELDELSWMRSERRTSKPHRQHALTRRDNRRNRRRTGRELELV